MCGIAGIFNTSSRLSMAAIRPRVQAMMDAISHRGPDDHGIYCDGNVCMGVRRLSILDLTPAGHMPMIDEEAGNCIVHNGEVYNYKELKAALNTAAYKSRTDTEVILKYYAAHGETCVRYFNGMYGFSIMDKKRNRLFCARDRLGIKPFFYAVHEGAFYFASEIEALLRAGIPRRPNMKIIYDYLANGVYDHSEETFFDGIKQLPAGHIMIVEPDRIQIKKYWDLTCEMESPGGSENFSEDDFRLATEQFIDILSDSVSLRLRSDVPIAVHVSGGLDSTLMLAVINRINGGQGMLKAFSYYFNEEKYDEKAYSEELVRKAGWRSQFYSLGSSDVPALFEEVMRYQGEPFPGILTLAKHKLIKESRDFGAKVILEGQGGDEIGGGYQYNFGPRILDILQSGNAARASAEVEAFGAQNGVDKKKAYEMVFNGLASFFSTGRSADGTQFVRAGCLDPDFARSFTHSLSFPKPFRSNLLNMQYRDILYTKLPRILRSCDRTSMAFGRELRVPMLDYRLVEFAFKLPGGFKIRNGTQRYFMREALKTFFDSRLTGLPKRAVVDPQREWLKGPLCNWVKDIINSDTFAGRGIFNRKEVLKEYAEYVSAESNANSFHIWQWLSLELWFRTFIDGGNNRERSYDSTGNYSGAGRIQSHTA